MDQPSLSAATPQPRRLAADVSGQAIAAGLLAAVVGYASSVAILIQGLAAVGASPAQVASGLVLVGITKGLAAAWLSWRSGMPISIAWSTPGLALFATTGAVAGGFPAAVGAFLLTGLLIAVAGLWQPLGRLVALIPRSLAAGMLAGILFRLCLGPFLAIQQAPGLGLLVLGTWAVVFAFARLWAVPAALAVALAAMALDPGAPPIAGAWPTLVLVAPVLTWEAVVSLALPLFIVTMASQNIPGLAVLAANGYRPAVGPAFLATGLLSALSAPFGAPTINLAAITAALCAGPDAHPDPRRRYVAAMVGGLGYVLLVPLAGIAAALVLSSPPVLIQAVAGLALVGAFGGALLGAVEKEPERLPALVTLLVTASGLSFAGIGSAFWGLVLGGAMLLLGRAAPRR